MRHTTRTLRPGLTFAALAFATLSAATAEAGASDDAACWPVAADAANLTDAYHALPDDMVRALLTPTDCVNWPAAADAGSLGS